MELYSSDKRKSRKKSTGSRSFRNSPNYRDSRDTTTEFTKVTCHDCGAACRVPFVPRASRPVYCSDCFRQKSRHSEGSRNPAGNKSLQRQQRHFADGSEKFYATIQEKLFEILGGKTCSSCGFKDPRALQISSVFGTDDNSNGRGAKYYSWGKYISSPALARKELEVLCLNCKEIREPRPKPNEPRPKPKKSKYFPR